jgi:outer membrane protein TolC
MSSRPHNVVFWAVFFAALIGLPLAGRAGIPMPETADAKALAIIDETIQLEPDLLRPDHVPFPSGTGPLTLAQALETALANNTDMQTNRESVRTKALGLEAVRRGYGPQWAMITSGSRSESGVTIDDLRSTNQFSTLNQSLGVSQILPYGGNLAVGLGGGYSQTGSLDGSFSPRLSVSLAQPLLRGAGRDLQQEPLTQAKRRLLYALRNYKTQSENFAISVISDFLSIQILQEKIGNLQEKNAAYDKLLKRSKAFYDLGEETRLEVLRVTQEGFLVQQDILSLDLERRNRRALFEINLGLPPMDTLVLANALIPYKKLNIDREEAVRTALEKRVDIRTATNAVDDARRALKFAKRDLLPDLDLNVKADLSNNNARTSNGVISDDYSAGFTLSLPLEQTSERLALYQAWISLRQAERTLQWLKSTVTASIHNSINTIQASENAVDIQSMIVDSGGKRVEAAEIRIAQQQASTRELIEAKTILINALNSRLDLQLSHYLAILRLKRDMGVLDLHPENLLADTQ